MHALSQSILLCTEHNVVIEERFANGGSYTEIFRIDGKSEISLKNIDENVQYRATDLSRAPG
jgi:hypothetical protein